MVRTNEPLLPPVSLAEKWLQDTKNGFYYWELQRKQENKTRNKEMREPD